MPPKCLPSIQKVPPELMLRAFMSLNDFATLAAFFCTSRYLYQIWSSNRLKILGEVMPNAVPTPDALELLSIQRYSESLHRLQKEIPYRDISFEQALNHMEEIVANAKYVQRACELWEAQVVKSASFTSEERSHKFFQLSSTERQRFSLAFYRFLVLVTIIWAEGSLSNKVDMMGYKEVLGLEHIARWLGEKESLDVLLKLEITTEDTLEILLPQSGINNYHLMSEGWSPVCNVVIQQSRNALWRARDRDYASYVPKPGMSGLHKICFSFFDDQQPDSKSYK